MSYTEPLIPLFLAICVLAWRRVDKKARPTLTLGIVGLFLASWDPAAWLFSRPLEFSYRLTPPRVPVGLDAIVVLGSGATAPSSDRPYAEPDLDTVQHCAMAAWVAKKAGRVPVLACEGSHGRFAYPSVMRPLLEAGGVPPDSIWIEDRSHSTRENAFYGAQILRSRGLSRIALVTDAQSMPRAAAAFRKLGMTVDPLPCDLTELDLRPQNLLPTWKVIRRNEKTLHESVGLLWYWLHGWI
jgi:uncharacterized SAM-binding protein YcdF (DUF218 family)